ncbi:hypothetical protein CMPELA_25855 [Cupriavidus necator]
MFLSIRRSSNEYYSESLESVFRIPWQAIDNAFRPSGSPPP